MARRRSNANSSGGEWIFGAIAVAGLILVSIAQTLLGVFVTACAFLGLPCLIAVYVHRKEVRDLLLRTQSAEIPSSDQFDWSAEKNAIKRLLRQQYEIRGKIREIYEHGKKAGLRLTDASEGTRFDQRSGHGAKLNGLLDKLEQVESKAKDAVRSLQNKAWARMPDWQLYEERRVKTEWMRAYTESEYSAARVGVIAYFVAFIIAMLLPVQWLRYLSAIAFLVVPHMWMLYGPAAIAPVVGGIAAVTAQKLSDGRVARPPKSEAARAWSQIESDIRGAHWLNFDNVEAEENSRNKKDEEPARSAEEPPAENRPRRWFEVLGVAENAPAEEIKTAWRQRIREYHPDRVATHGAKLQEMAARESVAINQAYQQAQKLQRV